MPVTVAPGRISLEQTLHHMLSPLNLTFLVVEDGLEITTVETADERLEIRLYDVRHLFDPDVGIAIRTSCWKS